MAPPHKLVPMGISARLLLVILQCFVLVHASAQTTDQQDLLARVASHAAAGQFAAAVSLLDPYVKQHPTHSQMWLLLAQHQYWNKDTAGARRTYSAALLHHPSHPELRLAYARFLVETGDTGTAKKVLQPFGSDVAEAEAIRGTMAWRKGDLSAATRHFKSALLTSPSHPDAAASLATIRAASRPWIRLFGEEGTDSQPLHQRRALAEAGLFITPLHVLRAEVGYAHYSVADSVRPMPSASAGYRFYWPTARLEAEVVAGLIGRMDSTYWKGSVDAGFRLPHGMRVGARWERVPYLYTVSSLSENVETVGVQVSASINKAGWTGEVVMRRERFPDNNEKRVVYGWFMAPLIRAKVATVQAGYSYGYQHTAEHRFTPMMTSPPRPGRPPVWEGRYSPYYTPLNLQTHSVTAALAVQPLRGLTVRANGSYAFSGSEQTPYVYVAGRAPLTGLYDQKVQPWTARGSVAAALTSRISLQLEGAHSATSWYNASNVSLSLYARL